jgi:hypothetical protein
VSGGAGIQGNVNVGGGVGVEGDMDVIGDTSISGNANVSGNVDISGVTTIDNYLKISNTTYIDVSLQSVQATPVYIGDNTTATFSSNPLYVTDVSSGYEYALSNGTPYVVVSSGDVTTVYTRYNAFENSTRIWGTIFTSYDEITGLYTGSKETTVSGVIIYGEYLGIILPYKLKLTSFILKSSSNTQHNRVKDYVVIGSNDKNTWYSIFEGIAEDNMNDQLFLIENNETYYNQYRIIIKNIYTTSLFTICLIRVSFIWETLIRRMFKYHLFV